MSDHYYDGPKTRIEELWEQHDAELMRAEDRLDREALAREINAGIEESENDFLDSPPDPDTGLPVRDRVEDDYPGVEITEDTLIPVLLPDEEEPDDAGFPVDVARGGFIHATPAAGRDTDRGQQRKIKPVVALYTEDDGIGVSFGMADPGTLPEVPSDYFFVLEIPGAPVSMRVIGPADTSAEVRAALLRLGQVAYEQTQAGWDGDMHSTPAVVKEALQAVTDVANGEIVTVRRRFAHPD